MAFIYNIIEMEEELLNFQPFTVKMDAIVKVQQLHTRYVEVNEHWATLPPEIRDIESEDYGKEIAMISELKGKHLAFLVGMERDEQAAIIAQTGPEAMEVEVQFDQINIILAKLWALEPITTISKRKISNMESRIREVIASMDEQSIVRTPLIEQMIISFVTTRLDVLFKWHLSTCAIFTVENLLSFLHMRKNGIEPCEITNDGASTSTGGPAKKRALPRCPRCKGIHPLTRCPQFLTLTLEARRNTVIQARLCYNCLSSEHTTNACKNGICKRCSEKHNTLLCPRLNVENN